MTDCLILTCERDKRVADLLCAGLRRFWPEVRPVLVMDTDRSTETDVPPEIRAVARRVPFLRRVFDFPHIASTEEYVSLDSDCLIYGTPTEMNRPTYQAIPNGWDDPLGVEIWRDVLGRDLAGNGNRFCSGIVRMHRSMLLDNRHAAYDYVRQCILRGIDRQTWPGVICEQSLIAGLWRMTYPDNPLPYERYPYGAHRPGCAIWHMSSDTVSRPYGKHMIDAYEELV